MLNRIFQLLPVVFLASSAGAANDAFVGKWKVDPSKSALYDEMKIETLGTNRYAITFGPGAVDTLVADGSDQPALSGSTLSISVNGSNSWDVVRKMKGRMLIKPHWTLSETAVGGDCATTVWNSATENMAATAPPENLSSCGIPRFISVFSVPELIGTAMRA
jgi:hypothetical protein